MLAGKEGKKQTRDLSIQKTLLHENNENLNHIFFCGNK